jgi:hypothetical protein
MANFYSDNNLKGSVAKEDLEADMNAKSGAVALRRGWQQLASSSPSRSFPPLEKFFSPLSDPELMFFIPRVNTLNPLRL